MEICKNDVWGTVCDRNWHNIDAKVVCRQLGLSVAGIAIILACVVGCYIDHHRKYAP